MNRRFFLLTAPGILLATSPVLARQEQEASPIVESYRRNYWVTMTTRLTIPEDRKVTRVRVWHALPTKRSWSETTDGHGAQGVRFRPDDGKMERNTRYDSHHLYWEHENLSPGQTIEFQSSYKVRSAKRAPDFKLLAKASWSDLETNKPEKTLSEPLPTDVTQLLTDARNRATPSDAVAAICQWIDGNMRYDANVPFSPNNIHATLAARKGHCGHNQQLFREFCDHLGVQTRSVSGLNLHTPNPVKASLYKVRRDFANIHTWSEVFFPGVGWVEVEPGRTEGSFDIPSNWIQNNRWFQCYSVWVNENGKELIPRWRHVGDHQENDYKIENLIGYSETEPVSL
ncbi:MAG: transglutaminase domain-containing protein [Fibrella sp.]|nr:transglutaminase domain-containing protein [Armatimonadota bacterium]